MPRFFIGILFVALLIANGCSSPTATQAPSPQVGGVSVWLIPMDDFAYEEAVRLATALSDNLNLDVRATLNMGSSGLEPFADTTQFAAEEIFAMAGNVSPNLTNKRPDTAYLVLTQRDINSRDRSLRFNFAVHNRAKRAAVISTARLVLDQAGGIAASPTIRKRLFKMAKRSIGDVYFGYTRSSDIRDVMYSPIKSLADVDRLGIEYLGKKH